MIVLLLMFNRIVIVIVSVIVMIMHVVVNNRVELSLDEKEQYLSGIGLCNVTSCINLCQASNNILSSVKRQTIFSI